MQYHYVVCFDEETGKWSVEDETKYLDGNIWDEADQDWYWARDAREELIDERCTIMLTTLASIWPAVDTEV